MTDELAAFGPDFLWGVAASAYQVEGAATEGGRGPTTWDTFSAEPGRTHGGDTGAVACDHYHRYAADVALMKDLGVGAYRFSIAWSRIQPEGIGPANPEGLAFYDRLVDELLAQGITPAPTLFHWDTPQALEDRGGWLERDIAGRFADYAAIVGEHLADRVPMWITVNEPMVLMLLGYALGVHAPGKRLLTRALPAAHHQLLAHGLGVQALRAAGAANIGIANAHDPTWAASHSEADQAAAAYYHDLVNATFADSVLLGTYPETVGSALPGPVADDLAVIATPIDWYGVNYYRPTRVGAPAASTTAPGDVAAQADFPFETRPITGYPTTDFGWPVVPAALGELLAQFRTRYGDALPPIYITENGCAYGDEPDASGRIADGRRIAFLDGHLRELRAAIEDGADVRGYFQWSILDNFEWAKGYSMRFGLVHVDFDTLVRTPKDSFAWYRDVIASTRR